MDELIGTLKTECFVLNQSIVVYQDELNWLNRSLRGLNSTPDESKLKLEAIEKDMEDQWAQYAELYEKSMHVVSKAMLKVQADLFREFRGRKSDSGDIEKDVKEYENIRSEDEVYLFFMFWGFVLGISDLIYLSNKKLL